MSRSYLCNASVLPMRAVKLDTTVTVGGYVIQAGAGDRAIGISQTGTRQPPIPGLDDGFAGVQNSNAIEVLEAEDEGWAEIGAAVTVGDLLKPSTAGVLITASGDGDIFIAMAMESGTANGQIVKVRVLAPNYRGA